MNSSGSPALLLIPTVSYVSRWQDYFWTTVSGKSSPHEIMDAFDSFGDESRPIWKSMHFQPIYRMNAFVTGEGNGRGRSKAYISGT